ncbi:hypothetical protein [Streptomyces hokutonensis]|uniref:hypothetical protein n=1 Tax=Streptomyces hokutonensis TaxID=1306990 RepID=UPI0038304328
MPKYSDDLYAAALNQLHAAALRRGKEPELPGKHVREPVMRDGTEIKVPIGSHIDHWRNGRGTAPSKELCEALLKYGQVPSRGFQEKWWLDLNEKRPHWTDALYAKALNEVYDTARKNRQVPVLPGRDTKTPLVQDGKTVYVPAGPHVYTFQHAGFKNPPDRELTEALSKFGLVSGQHPDPDGMWRVRPSSQVAGTAPAGLNPVASMPAVSATSMDAAAPAEGAMSSLSGVPGYDLSGDLLSAYTQQQLSEVARLYPAGEEFDHELQDALLKDLDSTGLDFTQPFDPALPGDMLQPGATQRLNPEVSAYAQLGYEPPSVRGQQLGGMQQPSGNGQQPGGMPPSAYPYPPPLSILPSQPLEEGPGQDSAGRRRRAPEEQARGSAPGPAKRGRPR